MSGGSSGTDPYHQKDPPKRSKAKEEELPESYRNSVKPKRIEATPSSPEYPRGKTVYYYDCEHCAEEIKGKRKTRRHAFCDRSCQHEWQKYGKPPSSIPQKGGEEYQNLANVLERIKNTVPNVQVISGRPPRPRIPKEDI